MTERVVLTAVVVTAGIWITLVGLFIAIVVFEAVKH